MIGADKNDWLTSPIVPLLVGSETVSEFIFLSWSRQPEWGWVISLEEGVGTLKDLNEVVDVRL